MAEWSNAPDSKSGVQVYLYRGFESLSFRQKILKDRCKSMAFFVFDQRLNAGTRTGTRLVLTDQP